MEEIKSTLLKYLPNLGSALIIAIIGIIIAFIAVHFTRRIMTRRKVDLSLSNFICKAVRILIYAFTLLAAMSALHVSITGVVAFFSAAAAAVALALKDRLNDIASGIVILFSKPFVTGDFVEFDKYRGYVQRIDILHTNILTNDGTNVIIPNSVISGTEVNNYTAQPIIRVQVDIPIPYNAEIKQVKNVLFGVLSQTNLLIHDEKHQDTVRLEKYGESALEFHIRCYCNFEDYWTVYYDLTERVKEALDENHITIPFNQLDVHINP